MFAPTLVLRAMDRRLNAGLPNAAFSVFLGALCAWNEAVYRLCAAIGRPLPSVYEACRYVAESPGNEEWLDILELLARGEGDCEDLACAEVGRLRSMGIDARPAFHPRVICDPNTGAPQWIYHVIVLYPGGHLDDPSRALGMLSANRPE